MNDKSNYETEKEFNKQKLVRNEFLYNSNSVGKYEFPLIRKQTIEITKIKFISYINCKINDEKNKGKTVHFFTHDWKFDKIYTQAQQELDKLKQYYCLLSPDFSIFTNMPLALQIANIFKNRWCGAYWQSKGLNVIPTVSWGDEKSFEFCFDGIEKGAIVAVCTYYRENDEISFMHGYNEMLKIIDPSVILCYGEPFKSMRGNIVSFVPTTHEWAQVLPPFEQARFYMERHTKNITGLNPMSFKYFKYRDPYSKDYIANCPVCGKICLTDEYGNGECKNCLWQLDKACSLEPDKVQYPNVVSLNTAKKLYAENKKIKPSFDDFAAMLEMYGETSFIYNGEKYAVYIGKGYRVTIHSDKNDLVYDSIIDFKENAMVDGQLLKKLWNNVEKANYLQG